MSLIVPDKSCAMLIEKVSDAIGGVFAPSQIKRKAHAEAEAKKIAAQADIDIVTINERAAIRLQQETIIQQENIENIIGKSFEHVKDENEIEGLEKDWLAAFFDVSKKTSDDDMQTLWAKILAGQANKAGSFSRKTIGIINSLEKEYAKLFTEFGSFVWNSEDPTPIILDDETSFFIDLGFNIIKFQHLEHLGLIRHQGLTGVSATLSSKIVQVNYYGQTFILEFNTGMFGGTQPSYKLDLGKAIFTQAGRELFAICGSERSESYLQHTIEQWKKDKITIVEEIICSHKTP